MATNKRYYWLKLPNDFFQHPKIKKLRKIAGGDTYTIIYLKLMLLTLKTDGILQFENIEETFEEELSLILDEDVENIKVTVAYLLRQGLMEVSEIGNSDNTSFFMSQVPSLIGKESTSAARVRKHREKFKNKSKNIQALQCNADVTECNATVTSCNTEIEIEIEKEIEKKELPQEKKVTKSEKSGGKNEFFKTKINQWLKIKSRGKNNPSAYAASLKSKIIKGDESVIEEFEEWLKQKEKQREAEKLIYFRNKKIMLKEGEIYEVLGVEAKEDGLHVYLDNPYQNSHQILFSSFEEIEKRIQHAS